jgi:hypothetical protein
MVIIWLILINCTQDLKSLLSCQMNLESGAAEVHGFALEISLMG